ncbi:TonB-dependent receptor [Bibersteinia trehalosi]|uniref:TonB-dependent receptor n=1 Tax=Bibersteinia trehalosi TaxID=47735 RepID=A0A426FF51_BIBTR|nr:TonB-dependent receptor plug domain-containing protein [Bibersteinia trehalosi]RRN00488.1 TonB-dependent receptor [Bibersteinia trehalosi]
MKKTKLALLVAGVTLGYYPFNLLAQESETVEFLDEVLVRATSFSQQIGTQQITEEQIKRRPTTNGNITELLKSNPNVAFSNLAGTSLNAGEIKPEEVSFHGEKFYNNNFTIDGISNNDNLNPAAGNLLNRQNGAEVYELPSEGSQSFWVDTKLLKRVEVFDSNISAKYGNFTGGVVNADIKDPNFEKPEGYISYRTSRGSWAKFHVQEKDVEDFYNAKRYDFQPDFTKQTYGISVSQPLNDNFALLFAYNRNQSDIKYVHPYLYLTDNPAGLVTETQKRLSENYLLKGVYLADNGDVWKATFMYSPHKSTSYKPNVMNGGYTNTGGGYSFNLNWEKQFESFKMNTAFAYKAVGNEIEHDADVYRRYVSTGADGGAINWRSNATGKALYGGFGTYETEKKTYTLKQDISFNEFDWAGLSHKVILGWSAELAQAQYKRNHEAWQYYYTSANIACSGMNECIEGEQYATSAQAYAGKHVKVNDSSYAAYLEDQMKWKNVDLNVGLRLDYNQYLKNLNLAPRISFNYDVFANEKTNLFAGYNRYYANSMLAYKLREGIGNTDRWYRNENTGYQWVYRSSTSSHKSATSDLKTPYSDEYVLGAGQKFAGMEAVLKWVHRKGRNQFSREVKDGYYTLANKGWSKNDTVTLTLKDIAGYEWKYAKLGVDFSVRYNRNKTNNSNYDATQSYFDNQYAVYNGQLIYANDLPSRDFNNKWAASLEFNTEFPSLNLNWGQRITYVGRFSRIAAKSSSINCQYETNKAICGDLYGQDIDATEYEDLKNGTQFIFDWRFVYKQPTFRSQYIELTLDVNNVFNTVAKVQNSSNTIYYKMGRNFWLGASYNW